MQTASPAFAAAMLSSDQSVAQRILVSLPANDVNGNTIPSSYSDVSNCVVSINGDVADTTSVPEGSLIIDGYSAAAATLVLKGPLTQPSGVQTVESETVYWLFNPNDPTSPMYRLPRLGLTVTLQEGRWVGGSTPEYVTVGTLIVDTIATSAGTVTMTLIDGRNSIRGQAYLPPVITQPPQNAGLTSEFAVDALLRGSPYLSRPALRPNCVFAAGFRASIWPEVGSYGNFAALPAFVPGMFGTALTNANQPIVTGYNLASPVAGPIFGEVFATKIASGGSFSMTVLNATSTYQVVFEWFSDGNLYVFTISPSGQSGASSISLGSTGAHYFAIQTSWAYGSTSVTGTYWVDGTPHAFSLTAADARPSNDPWTLARVGAGSGTIEGLQITSETSPGSSLNNDFVPTLILDPSLNPLTALPDVSGKDKWGALQDIAAAEAAVFNIDELNVAHFTNRNSIAAKTSSLTLSSRVNLTGLDTLEQQSTQYTHVTVPVNQIRIAPYQIVWQSSTPIQVNPGAPTVVYATMENPAVNVPTQDSGFLNDSTTWSYQNAYWMADVLPDGTGTGIGTGVSFTVQQLSATQLKITIYNANSGAVYLVAPPLQNTPAGTPALIIGGQPILSVNKSVNNNAAPVVGASGAVVADAQWPPAAFGGAASNPAGDIVLSIPANDWVQSLDAAQSLADHYLSDFHVALPLLRNTTIVSDPRTQLLDRVTIADPDVSLASMDALIVGIHFSYGGGTGNGQYWTRNFDLRSYWPPGAWVLGVPGMSELGDGSSIQGTAYAY